MRSSFFVGLFFILSSQRIFATEQTSFAQSPMAMFMGNAYTARADDGYTLFYNPAGLARNKGVEFYPINLNLGAMNALTYLDKFTAENKDPGKLAENFSGVPIHLELGSVPSLKFGPVGVSMFIQNRTNVMIRNSIHPSMNVDYNFDKGFVMGYAHTFGRSSPFNNASEKGWRHSIGVSFKQVTRDAIRSSNDLFGAGLYSDLVEGKIKDLASLQDVLGYSSGTAYGADFGMESVLRMPLSELSFGVSVMDIGNTHFVRASGDGPLPEQPMTINTGVTWRQDFWLLDYSVNFDFRPVLTDIPLARKIHWGVDLGLPTIRLMFGMDEGYLGYGLRFKFWPVELLAGLYTKEIGHDYKEEGAPRFLIYLSLLNFSFDA